MKTSLLIVCAACLTGCTHFNLPEVTAENAEYHRTDPFGGTHITATGVRVDKDAGTIKADSATWTTTYPAFSVRATIKGYERKLAK